MDLCAEYFQNDSLGDEKTDGLRLGESVRECVDWKL